MWLRRGAVAVSALLRPALFIIVSTSFIIGYYWDSLVSSGFTCIPGEELVFDTDTILWLTVLLLVSTGAHLMNDSSDSMDVDRISGPKDHVNAALFLGTQPGRLVSAAAALFAAAFLISLPYEPRVAALVALGGVVSYMYSVRPRLKGSAPLDLVMNTIGLLAAPMAAGAYAAGSSPDPWALAAFSLIAASYYIDTAVVDMAADAAAGLRTTAVALGDDALIASLLLNLAGSALFMAVYSPPLHVLVLVALSIAAHVYWAARRRLGLRGLGLFTAAMYLVGLAAAYIVVSCP